MTSRLILAHPGLRGGFAGLLAPLAAMGLDETPPHLPGLVLGVEPPPEHVACLQVACPGDDVPSRPRARATRRAGAGAPPPVAGGDDGGSTSRQGRQAPGWGGCLSLPLPKRNASPLRRFQRCSGCGRPRLGRLFGGRREAAGILL